MDYLLIGAAVNQLPDQKYGRGRDPDNWRIRPFAREPSYWKAGSQCRGIPILPTHRNRLFLLSHRWLQPAGVKPARRFRRIHCCLRNLLCHRYRLCLTNRSLFRVRHVQFR